MKNIYSASTTQFLTSLHSLHVFSSILPGARFLWISDGKADKKLNKDPVALQDIKYHQEIFTSTIDVM